MSDFRQQFLRLALRQGALRFGAFTLKSGRVSPYFFNAGLFNTGLALKELGEAYASRLVDSGLPFDMLYGPAYKGIPLASVTAVALAAGFGQDVPVAFNRKEAKDHGEAGVLIGAPLRGKVLIIDDVITAGTSVRESVDLIRAHGAEPCGVLIAVDRQERGQGNLSAAEEVTAQFGIPVLAIAGLPDLLAFASADSELVQHREALLVYRSQYGVAAAA
ncbi:orotate phosphoribosyltransferase [Ahniella affigens]|uniref:Orotate phosphoribosyltransferase n=1 Tax=Ahniella affigens TaxID=2021234 RepID=A0A2P1PLU7_9GAMM|nr:orotate phosphoribosyltransferase [Ahniella affigens]AVP95818.1 orotate phosphoribosyltransferase [Ahniella affigens]